MRDGIFEICRSSFPSTVFLTLIDNKRVNNDVVITRTHLLDLRSPLPIFA